jgi:hypothetical protein
VSGKIAPIKKRLEWLIQTVRVEQFIVRTKAVANADDRELLEMVHRRVIQSRKRLLRSVAQFIKRREVRRGKTKTDVDELTRLWQLEPPKPGTSEPSVT